MWLEVSGQDRLTVSHLNSSVTRSSVQQHEVNMTSANNTPQQINFHWENTFWRDANVEKENIDY